MMHRRQNPLSVIWPQESDFHCVVIEGDKLPRTKGVDLSWMRASRNLSDYNELYLTGEFAAFGIHFYSPLEDL